ncbi:helix-turn-helix domain-containing protein [Marinobacterium sp. AK62]|uniref:Helix-turn-helix domain-containing protein n=1 Tax=Marinobacterium alkalitolerans TaxID=1542925 RepID=A0ABS3Z7U3_9GAMM|nr:helix-turn-helix domain-containing protein [Marinobacterium alkalitolerans]MBP0047671.1 helix-turn-helix domain-containing protein [Marinobacterium alkalitolerans]
MSMTLMVEALKAKVGNPGRKLVLVKLADNANDKGECWPSYQHVADQCEMGRSTVKAHVKALEEAGFLTVVERNGGKSSNKYRLHIEAGKATEKPKHTRSESAPVKNKPGQDSTAPRSKSDTTPRSNPDPRTSHSPEPVIEPDDDAGASSSIDTAPDQPAELTPEQAHHAAIFSHQDTAPAVPANSADRNTFPMHWQWLPSDWFTERCRTAGVNLSRLDSTQQESILGEFRSYWEATGNEFTQAQWEHKLLRQLQRALSSPATNQATRQQTRSAVSSMVMDGVMNPDSEW